MKNAQGRKPNVAKLLKGLTEKGGEFYFSKRPSSKKSDHAEPKATPAKVQTLVVKKKK